MTTSCEVNQFENKAFESIVVSCTNRIYGIIFWNMLYNSSLIKLNVKNIRISIKLHGTL